MIDDIIRADQFSLDERNYDVQAWKLHNADSYKLTITFRAPKGRKFQTPPANQKLVFKDSYYNLNYAIQKNGDLIITREFYFPISVVAKSDYQEFKQYVNKISKADNAILSWK